ncbi:MAG: hypothetical protein Q7R39_06005 [Dehalococcoidia bacterium]|nr:hypothetical protein [Dehalococcoidia bacterium]
MRRVILLLFGLLVVLAGTVVVLALAGVGSSVANPADCRPGNVLEGVHDPERLAVLDRCVTAQGTVAVIETHGDGDWHMGIIPDPGDLDLLGRANVTKLGGLLVAEVIPKDQSTVKRPSVGARIEVTGAYVIDTPYGWREIHPVWTIRELTASPVPPGVGQKALNAIQRAERVLLRVRAEIKDVLVQLRHGQSTETPGGEID